VTCSTHERDGNRPLVGVIGGIGPLATAYFLGTSTENPGPVMADDARRLESFGASFLVGPVQHGPQLHRRGGRGRQHPRC